MLRAGDLHGVQPVCLQGLGSGALFTVHLGAQAAAGAVHGSTRSSRGVSSREQQEGSCSRVGHQSKPVQAAWQAPISPSSGLIRAFLPGTAGVNIQCRLNLCPPVLSAAYDCWDRTRLPSSRHSQYW
jgi:hypothetical protein